MGEDAGGHVPEVDDAKLTGITTDPRYRRLVQRRGRFTLILTSVMLILYFGYILLIAFRKDLLARPIGDGVTSFGIPIGIGIILAGIALTGLYIRRANREYDPLVSAIRADHDA